MGKVVEFTGANRNDSTEDNQTKAAASDSDTPLEVWECQCGCRLFYMTKEGHMCSECETIQVYG